MDLATAKVGMPMPKMTIAHRCPKNKEYLDLLLVLAWDYFSFHLPHCKYIYIYLGKVKTISKVSLDVIPSPSVKTQIIGGKVCLSCEGKKLLGVVNKLLKTKSLLTSPSIVLPYYLK